MAPAATNLSPVTRDYPSRARAGFFQAAALRLFYQGTGRSVRPARSRLKPLFWTTSSPGKVVN